MLAGSTLLKVLDNFALNSHNASHPVTSENIGMPFTSILYLYCKEYLLTLLELALLIKSSSDILVTIHA